MISWEKSATFEEFSFSNDRRIVALELCLQHPLREKEGVALFYFYFLLFTEIYVKFQCEWMVLLLQKNKNKKTKQKPDISQDSLGENTSQLCFFKCAEFDAVGATDDRLVGQSPSELSSRFSDSASSPVDATAEIQAGLICLPAPDINSCWF